MNKSINGIAKAICTYKEQNKKIELEIYCKTIDGALNIEDLIKYLKEKVIYNRDITPKICFNENYPSIFEGLYSQLKNVDVEYEDQLEQCKHPDRILKKYDIKTDSIHLKVELVKGIPKRRKTFKIIQFLIILFTGIIYYNIPSFSNNLYNSSKLTNLTNDLEKIFPTQPLVTSRIVDGLFNHYGKKPVVFHFIGKGENYVELVTRLISKNLLGSEKNDKLLTIKDENSELIQMKMYEQIQHWKDSLIVIHLDVKKKFEGLDFLIDAFNDFGASISWSRFTPISTKLCTFIIVSNVINSTEFQSIHELEKIVKEKLTQQNWSNQLTRRLQNIIPFK